MSASISPATGKRYGVELVCHIGGFPRSTYYANRVGTGDPTPTPAQNTRPKKRGPATPIPDDELLQWIREDLKASPWKGEGHRKVHARLRRHRCRVGHNRVLRIMRENNLLSPHRCRCTNDGAHDGTIITEKPNELWATDGTQTMTIEDGNVWIFAAVEHWNAECVGWHVSKLGNRFSALQPIAMALNEHYGSPRPGLARGLSLRMDHGCQYTSDAFQQQIKSWGIAASFGLVGQLETNGVAERFFRTLKEQVIYGQIFQNLEELRQAIATFVATYNSSWILEKNGYASPSEMRAAHQIKIAA
jgi:putative transposase